MPFIFDDTFTCGQHEGELVSDVAFEHPEYLSWTLANAVQLGIDDVEVDTVRAILIAALPIPGVTAALVPVVLEGVVEDTVPAFTPLVAFAAMVPSRPKIEWTEEQLAVIDVIEEWFDDERGNAFLSLTGPAGVGKSVLTSEIIERLDGVQLTAMTGKAALRLAEVTGRDASTLHKVLYWPPKPGEDVRFTRLRDPESNLVLVDEASMVSPMIYRDLQEWKRQGVRLLLVGDPYQLPPVITGEDARTYGEDYSVFSHVEGPRLTTVMRNAGGILQAATHVRETGRICTESFPDERGGYEFRVSDSALNEAVDAYCNDREDHMLITWKNTHRMKANHMIRERFGHGGPLPDNGEPVLFKKNGQGVLNGEIGICDGFEDGPLLGSLQTLWMYVKDAFMRRKILVSVHGSPEGKGGEFFDGGMPWIVDFKKYHIDLRNSGFEEPIPISWAYCLTCHSAQGSEQKRVTVFLGSGDEKNRNFNKSTTLPWGGTAPFSARFVYTSLTRSKVRATLIVNR